MRRLRSWWWKILLGLVGVLVLLQFVPYRVDHPSARDEPRWDSPRTRELAMGSCGDCHSNETKVAWFEQLAPLHWYIADHVKHGRAALNFSEWHTAAGEEADDAARPVARGTMPPGYYTRFGLHGDAKLSPAEVEELVAGLEKTIAADPPEDGRGGTEAEAATT